MSPNFYSVYPIRALAEPCYYVPQLPRTLANAWDRSLKLTTGHWKAIVADTDAQSAAGVRKCVQALGYETEAAATADAIVSAIGSRTRVIVIVAASLPALDAAQLCRDVRLAANNSHVILLVDGQKTPEIERAFEAGADDVLIKPYTAAELRARLHLADRVVGLEEYRTRTLGEGTLLAEISVNASLHSRQYLEVELGRELDRARRFAHPIGVLLTQTHPPTVGERTLRAYGEFVCEHLRTRVDWVARYAERSFAVILPETTLDGAAHVAERLQLALQQQDGGWAGLPGTLKANIGVCAFDRASTIDVPSAQTLLSGAELQLRSANRGGFGRIAAGYPPPPH